jgi:5-bromo-4-chloroindolyl phosphate hydrolysis protein
MKVILIKILIVVILIIGAFLLGKFLSRQRKKRANELKDDDFEYIKENFNENDNKLVN